MTKRIIHKTIFWAHLVSGLTAGVVILMMSITGVLLTYEHQMVERADMKLYRAQDMSGQRISIQDAITVASQNKEGKAEGVKVRNAADAPYEVTFGRRGGSAFIDAYTGQYLGTGEASIRQTFRLITSWHRWFNLSGDARDTGKMLTGVSNLLFLFLVFSGLYIWLPHIWTWKLLKNKLWFNAKATSARARDYNWHHVFGFWSAVPLIVVVATATVFSYSWSGALLYAVVGAQAPEGRGSNEQNIRLTEESPQSNEKMTVDDLLMSIQKNAGDWKSIVVPANADNNTSSFNIHYSAGNQPQKVATWVISHEDGSVINKMGWEDKAVATRARTAVRFLHTGEYLGVVGQTIAGLVSLFSVLMVWTGFTLAYRRLIQPLFKR